MEYNKLIAEFMSGIPSSVPNLINLPQTIGESRILCVKGSEGLPSGTYAVKRISDLKYHTSWDWLMPVVQKIGDDYYNTPFDETFSKLTEGYENIWTIEDTYKAVVEFIQEYNRFNV